MNKDKKTKPEQLQLEKEWLLQEGYTCLMFQDNKRLTSRERGVKPLLVWLDSKENVAGFTSVDKVVGKAAAFLYVLLGVSRVYGLTISEKALEVLERYGIEVVYDRKTEVIRNRDNTGFCPMEQAVWDIEEPEEALEAIRKKLEQLTGKML